MSGGKAAQLARKEGEFIVSTRREVYESLANDKHFLLFMGWLLQRCGFTDVIDTNNGSEMFKIHGRRQIAVETLNEVKAHDPEFYERVLAARRAYEQDLNRLKLTPEDEKRADEEND